MAACASGKTGPPKAAVRAEVEQALPGLLEDVNRELSGHEPLRMLMRRALQG